MKSVSAIWVDDELCKDCGICIDLCPRAVFDSSAGKPVATRLEDCSGCLFCEWHCPEFAVRVHVDGASQQAVEVGTCAVGAS